MSPRFKRLAPFFLLGPISGPLVAGVLFNLRERPILATLYALALAEVSFLLPTVAGQLGLTLMSGVS